MDIDPTEISSFGAVSVIEGKEDSLLWMTSMNVASTISLGKVSPFTAKSSPFSPKDSSLIVDIDEIELSLPIIFFFSLFTFDSLLFYEDEHAECDKE